MFRALLIIVLCAVAIPAYADPIDDIAATIFEGNVQENKPTIKAIYRSCSSNEDCVAVMSLCRWRPVNKQSEQNVSAVSSRLKLECRWPPPPAEAPAVVCTNRLCQIAPDGK